MQTIERTYSNGKASPGIEMVIRELATLRAQNKQLRSQLAKRDRRSTIVERATVDAHCILSEAFSTGQTGRDVMRRLHGMSVRRWGWAVAFLRYAGIVFVASGHWQDGLKFAVDDLDRAIALLEHAARELATTPDALRRLRRFISG